MKLKGDKELIDKLKRMDKNVQIKTQQEVLSAIMSIESIAINRSLVDTGNLKASWFHEHEGYKGRVANSAEYANHVEFIYKPMLFPAYETIHPQFISNLESMIKGLS